MTCERAREFLPDLIAGPADAGAAAHVAACPECGREMAAFREVMEAASRYSDRDVPDPGEEYWDRFLPSVRSRLARRDTVPSRVRPAPLAAAAAALLLVAAAAAALLAPAGPAVGSDPVAEAGKRLDEAIEAMPGLAPRVAADMLGTDPLAGIPAARILEAIDEIDRAPAWASGWPDSEADRILDQLTAEQAARLKAEISAERG